MVKMRLKVFKISAPFRRWKFIIWFYYKGLKSKLQDGEAPLALIANCKLIIANSLKSLLHKIFSFDIIEFNERRETN